MGSGQSGKEADGESGREAAASSSSSRNDGEAVAGLLALIDGGTCGLLGEAVAWTVTPGGRGLGGGSDSGAALSSAESCNSSTFPSAHQVIGSVKDTTFQAWAIVKRFPYSSDPRAIEYD